MPGCVVIANCSDGFIIAVDTNAELIDQQKAPFAIMCSFSKYSQKSDGHKL